MIARALGEVTGAVLQTMNADGYCDAEQRSADGLGQARGFRPSGSSPWKNNGAPLEAGRR